MEETTPTKKIGLLNAISAGIFGVFAVSLIFALSTRFFGITGLYVGGIISLFIPSIGLYYTDGKSMLRIIFWSMLIFLILGIIGFFAGKFWLEITLDKLI